MCCNAWVTEWITWRRFDYESGAQRGGPFCNFCLVVDWQDLRWLFFCMRCRRRDPDLRCWYTDGTDSEDDDDQPLAVGENSGSRYYGQPRTEKRTKVQ